MPIIESSPITATEVNIAKVFSDDYAFEIPSYQRPYAWEVTQARELLSDLEQAISDQPTGSQSAYFLGSIVLIKSPGVPESKIVDGQQRLTTLTILLSVLRDLTLVEAQKIKRHTYICQSGDPDLGTNDRYRLLLRERDRNFFEKTIQNKSATDNLPDANQFEGSLRRIAENAAFLYERLRGMSVERRNILTAFIVQHCYLVVVAVPNPDAARRIFTVLNARGLDLTPTDILKADLLERVGPDRETSLAREWESIEEALGRSAFVQLFTHIRMLFEREKPRSSLEAAFRKVVPPFDTDPINFIPAILDPLADAMRLLDDLMEIGRIFGSNALRSVKSLARVDNKDWVAPALLLIWLRKQGRLTADEVSQQLIRLERVTYYLFVTRADVNDRATRFANVLDEIEPRTGRTGAKGFDLTAEERRQFIAAINGPLYRKTRVVKPVLQRLDEALSTGGATYEDPTSIEHVLPQTVEIGSEWEGYFPDESVRSCWTHKLSNLVLLTRRVNIRASNWDLDRKKQQYFRTSEGTSPYPLTQEVLNESTWNVQVLSRRQKRLMSKLIDVWQLKETQE